MRLKKVVQKEKVQCYFVFRNQGEATGFWNVKLLRAVEKPAVDTEKDIKMTGIGET